MEEVLDETVASAGSLNDLHAPPRHQTEKRDPAETPQDRAAVPQIDQNSRISAMRLNGANPSFDPVLQNNQSSNINLARANTDDFQTGQTASVGTVGGFTKYVTNSFAQGAEQFSSGMGKMASFFSDPEKIAQAATQINKQVTTAVSGVAHVVGEKVVYFAEHPAECLENACGQFNSILDQTGIKSVLVCAGDLVSVPYYLATGQSDVAVEHLEHAGAMLLDAGQKVVGMAYGMLKTSGILDVGVATYKLGKAGVLYAQGDTAEAKKLFDESMTTYAAAGAEAVQFIGYATGVTFITMGVAALNSGNYVDAAEYLGMGALSVSMIAFTGYKLLEPRIFRGAAVDGAEFMTKAAGKYAGEQAVKLVPKEICERIASTTLDEALPLIQKLQEQGAAFVTKSGEVLQETTAKNIYEALKARGVGNMVEMRVADDLRLIANQPKANLIKHLEDAGASAREARRMAKGLKIFIGRQGEAGFDDAFFMEAYSREMTASIKTSLLDNGLRDAWKEQWAKQDVLIRDICKTHGLADSEIEGFNAKMLEHFEAGVEGGVKKVVDEAVAEAFKKFRKERRHDLNFGADEEAEEALNGEDPKLKLVNSTADTTVKDDPNAAHGKNSGHHTKHQVYRKNGQDFDGGPWGDRIDVSKFEEDGLEDRVA